MAIQQAGFKRKSKVASEIPDSSLADIAFLLLIFFMVSTVFREEEPRPIEPPEAAATRKVDEKRSDILHLWVEADGAVYINDQRVPLEEVSGVVSPLVAATEGRLVVAIRADRAAPYGVIGAVTEELREGGALRVNFATELERRLSAAGE